MPEMGEYVVGAYLKLILGCHNVIYNQKPGGQTEIDVLGLDLERKIVYVCEVKTHIKGLLVSRGGLDVTEETIQKQLTTLISYGEKYWKGFERRVMFWSPYVPVGKKTAGLERIRRSLPVNVEFVINSEYKKRVKQLQEKAKKDASDRGEPFYRALQILEHLRGGDAP